MTLDFPVTRPLSCCASAAGRAAAGHAEERIISPSYRPDIDGLRAFSIIAVVLYHAFPALLPGGFVGVDVFFVISGYLITGIILRETGRGSFSLAHFYRRRIQRIFPATLLVLVACLAVGWWVLLPYEYAMLGVHTAAGAAFVPNLVYWSEAGYFDADSRLKPLLHFWSLGVEEQFYLVWPGLLLLAARRRVPAAAILLAVGGPSFLSGVLTQDSASAFFLPNNRFWELLLGGALAALPAAPATRLHQLASLAGAALLLAAVAVIHRDYTFPRWWALLPTLATAALILAGERGIANRALACRPLVFVGLISFPLYLWHWPLLTFARIMQSATPAPWMRGCAVALAVLLAWLTWRLVERPLRYHPSRLVPAGLVAGMLLCATAGLLLVKAGGVPARTAAINATAAALQRAALRVPGDDCAERFDVPGNCISNGLPPRIAVVGDSHSNNVYYALIHHYPDTGIVRLGRGGCPPLYNVAVQDQGQREFCRAVTRKNLDWVLGNPDIDTVYLSSMGPMYLAYPTGRYRMNYATAPALEDNAAIFERALEDTVERLLAAGKRVVLVVDWPGLGFDPATCVDIRPLRLSTFTPRDCRSPRARHEQRTREYRKILDDIASRHAPVALWNTPAAFCDKDYCFGMLDGTLLYRDPGHLSLEGSRYLGEHLSLTHPTGG